MDADGFGRVDGALIFITGGPPAVFGTVGVTLGFAFWTVASCGVFVVGGPHAGFGTTGVTLGFAFWTVASCDTFVFGGPQAGFRAVGMSSILGSEMTEGCGVVLGATVVLWIGVSTTEATFSFVLVSAEAEAEAEAVVAAGAGALGRFERFRFLGIFIYQTDRLIETKACDSMT